MTKLICPIDDCTVLEAHCNQNMIFKHLVLFHNILPRSRPRAEWRRAQNQQYANIEKRLSDIDHKLRVKHKKAFYLSIRRPELGIPEWDDSLPELVDQRAQWEQLMWIKDDGDDEQTDDDERSATQASGDARSSSSNQRSSRHDSPSPFDSASQDDSCNEAARLLLHLTSNTVLHQSAPPTPWEEPPLIEDNLFQNPGRSKCFPRPPAMYPPMFQPIPPTELPTKSAPKSPPWNLHKGPSPSLIDDNTQYKTKSGRVCKKSAKSAG